MARKTVKFNSTGLPKLPNDKPVVYRILTAGGGTNYVGVAKRGRVQDRIAEHLGEIPGVKVRIDQFNYISDAREAEARIIKRARPKYNIKGK